MAKGNLYLSMSLLLSLVVLAGCVPTAFKIEAIPADQKLQETQIQRDKGFFVADKIAVIDVDGLLINRRRRGFMRGGDNPVSLFLEKLDKAAEDRNVKAVVLRINSPGGTVAASDAMYHSLREFKRKTSKPVVACILGVGCSGAYYLACGSDGIMAQPGSVTGSIGTIMQTISVAGTMEKIGVKAVAIKSGGLKDLASPLHDLTTAESKVLIGIVRQFFEQFLTVVKEGRKNIPEAKLQKLADGRIFTSQTALDEKLIDRIGYPVDGIEWAKELAGVEKARVVMYHRPLGHKANVYSSAMTDDGLVGALVNVELPDWLNSNGAQFLYLWQPIVE
jgi:protease-4